MKKTIALLLIIFGIYYFISIKTEEIIIPDDSIRLRVIPNSNDEYDQEIKNEVKNEIQNNLDLLITTSDNIETSREKIINNLDFIDNKVKNVLDNNNYSLGYNINFGKNYFPEKIYNGVTYNDGYYESLVITLGEGKGDNWWCVLFPPLCLIEADESDDVEYKSYIKETLDKYLYNKKID